MTIKRKRKRKSVKYDKLFVYSYEGEVFEYDLREWEVYKLQDWVDVVKKDKTELVSHTLGGILRVRFVRVEENKTVSIVKDVSRIKPIPPTVA